MVWCECEGAQQTQIHTTRDVASPPHQTASEFGQREGNSGLALAFLHLFPICLSDFSTVSGAEILVCFYQDSEH